MNIDLALSSGEGGDEEPTVSRSKPADGGGAVVVGAGFGRHYASALAQPNSPLHLSALVGRGGATGQRVANRLGVAYLRAETGVALPELHGFPRNVKAAIVAVRGQSVGGQGDKIATELLNCGIPVLQELPVDPFTVAEQMRRARRSGATFQVTGFYEHTGPVRSLVEAVAHLREYTTITHVHVRTCYQLLDRAGLILSEVLDAVPMGKVLIAPTASEEWKLVSGRWGQLPVDIMLAHRMDPKDPDNYSQPMASIVVETTEGELSWVGPASTPRWQQRPHSRASQLIVPNGKLDEPWCEEFLRQWPRTWGEVVEEVWPPGIHRAVARLCEVQHCGRGAEYSAEARRALLVLRWWKDVAGALSAPWEISATEPQLIFRPEPWSAEETVR